MIKDSGYDHLLKTWLVLDNHDTFRLVNILTQSWQQEMAANSPVHPARLGLSLLRKRTGDDRRRRSRNRAPMRWDLVGEGNQTLALHRKLLKIRREQPALRIGEFPPSAQPEAFRICAAPSPPQQHSSFSLIPATPRFANISRCGDSKMRVGHSHPRPVRQFRGPRDPLRLHRRRNPGPPNRHPATRRRRLSQGLQSLRPTAVREAKVPSDRLTSLIERHKT